MEIILTISYKLLSDSREHLQRSVDLEDRDRDLSLNWVQASFLDVQGQDAPAPRVWDPAITLG